MDSNLEQYNSATPTFPATADVNTNTDPYLMPTDGPVICADNNGANQAPVNRALRQIRDGIIGLRGALVGDFAGAVQKTVRSLYADLAGGVTHSKAAGTITAAGPAAGGTAIKAESGNIVASLGDVITSVGDIIASSGKIIAFSDYVQSFTEIIAGDIVAPAFADLSRGMLKFVGTAASGSNPANGTSIANQLRAVNVPKVWGCVGTTTVGPAINKQAGIGYSAAYNGGAGGTIDVTFTTAMDNADYGVVISMNNEVATGNCTPYAINKTATGFTIKGKNQNTNSQKSFGDEDALLGFNVFGRITT